MLMMMRFPECLGYSQSNPQHHHRLRHIIVSDIEHEQAVFKVQFSSPCFVVPIPMPEPALRIERVCP
jgi:hypothetical protein